MSKRARKPASERKAAAETDPLAFEGDRKRMFELVTSWIKFIDQYPGWREWNQEKIGITIQYGLTGTWTELTAFEFSGQIRDIHGLVQNYLEAESALRALHDVEFYFRTYPFKKDQIEKDKHLTYIAEMYFSRIYELKSKLKSLLNNLQSVSKKKDPTVSTYFRIYDDVFSSELKSRNLVHHHEQYDDVPISHLGLTGLLGDKFFFAHEGSRRRAYRRATTEWVKKVRISVRNAVTFVNFAAGRVVESGLIQAAVEAETSTKLNVPS